jgi:NitT/TauT family transport system permease protein
MVLAAILILWELVCRAFHVSDFIFPSPSAILLSLRQYAGPISGHALQTFWTTMAGFAIGVGVGLVIGVIVGSSRLMYTALYPLMVGFNSIPKAAFVPVLVVWFGIGTVPAILTAFIICFFPITVNVATGLATIEPELEDVLRALGASRMDVLIKVGLPRSLPFFFASLKVAITLAFADAHAAGVRRPDRHQRDGNGHVRSVRGDGAAHDRLGHPRDGCACLRSAT